MRHDEALGILERQISVAHVDVCTARAWLLHTRPTELSSAVTDWPRKCGFTLPDRVVLIGDDVTDSLGRVARALSLQLACAGAIWEVIGRGLLMPVGESRDHSPNVGWSDHRPGGSGTNAGWPLPTAQYAVPDRGIWVSDAAAIGAASAESPTGGAHGAPQLHPGVARALREAQACFRFNFLTPALAMLGAASEGGWMLLASSLAAAKPEHDRSKAILRELERETGALGPTVRKVREWLDDRDIGGELLHRAGCSRADIADAALWSNEVRDSRNALHWGAAPGSPNSYDKVATLLVVGIRMLALLQGLADAAAEAPGTPSSPKPD